MELSVTKAADENIEDIRNIARVCWENICKGEISSEDTARLIDEEYHTEKLADQIEASDSWFYLLVDADRIVGFAFMMRKADEKNVGLMQKLFVLPEYQEHKIVYKLFQHMIQQSTAEGITEIEVYYPECAKQWIQIFTQIGLEFEPWRKFDKKVGTRDITIWPGLLVIVPDF